MSIVFRLYHRIVCRSRIDRRLFRELGSSIVMQSFLCVKCGAHLDTKGF